MSLAQAQLRLNEFSAHDGFTINGETHDWIEVTNSGDEPVSLSDYFLTDNPDDLEKWAMPVHQLQPQEILLLLASGEDVTELGGHWESIINADNIWSYNVATNEPISTWMESNFDDSPWNSAAGGFGYADNDDNTIIPEGTNSVYQRITFNASELSVFQELQLHADYDDGFVAYLNGIEIARSFNVEGNPPAFNAGTNMYTESNSSQGLLPEVYEIPLSALQSGQNTLAIHTLNVGTNSSDFSSNYFLLAQVSSGGLLYQNTPDWFQSSDVETSFYQTNFKLKTGEFLIISDSEGVTIDSHIIPDDLRLGITKGRFPDGTGDWCYIDTPTPNDSNAESWCYEGIATPPEISVPSGWYSEAQTVTASADGTIRFSLNGDYPDENSPVFFSTAEFSENTSFSMRTFPEENLIPSEVVDRTYIFEEDNHDLPVISIHSNEAGLFDYNMGIYEFGPNADLDNFPHFGSNFWEPWSRFARLEYFNSNKELEAVEHLDLEIHGGWSRGFSQKSFRLDFKSQYTGDLEVPVFSKKPWIEEFNNLNIRSGGQHVWDSKIQDGLFSDLVNETHIDNMGYEPCLLYINGEFWGVYGMREKIDGHYVESNHGVENDEIDLLNAQNVLDGTDEHFATSVNELLGMNPESPFFYNTAASYFDLENYMDYFIAETYYQNVDWMGIAWGINNIKLWREQTEGAKWRYVMYDLDAGFGHFWGNPWDNYLWEARNPDYVSLHSQLFNKLLENNQFRCEFAKRYADLINTIYQPENFNEVADELRDKIWEAMSLQELRWNENMSVVAWLDEVESIKEYNEARVGFARNNLDGNLGLGGAVELSFNVQPEGAGQITVNTITPDSYPWSGVYFNGCPVEITATAAEGYEFTGWSPNEEYSDSLTSENILSALTTNSTFTANFDAASGVEEIESEALLSVSPNPSSGEFKLEYNSSKIEQLDVQIFNALGERVYSSRFPKTQRVVSKNIDLSHLHSGMYMVRVATETHTKSTSFIKQ